MICQNCGTQNALNSRFCIKCGTPINVNNNQTINQETSRNGEMQQPVNNMGVNNFSPTASPIVNNMIKTEKVKMSFIEYFTIILGVLLKPFTTLKDKLNNFDNLKNSIMLSIIVTVIAVLLALVKTIISTVRVTTGNFFSDPKTEWIWENMKEIEFLKVIGMNLLFFGVVLFVIVGVYYISGLVIKKQTNFSRLLGITAISVVPLLLCWLLFSPLLEMIYYPLGMVVTILGAVYSLLILYETVNHEIPIEGNAKYYFNLICLSILCVASYYLYMKIFMAAGGDLSDYFDMFR